MPLEKFKDDLVKKRPRRVSAGKLDRNFAKCYPAKRGLLERLGPVNESESGWFIDREMVIFDVCENGNPVQYAIPAVKTQ